MRALVLPSKGSIRLASHVPHIFGIIAIAACAILNVALASTLTGEVVRVIDGDTVVVLDRDNAQHKVRLAGIDAPERKQAFGEVSKQHLASLVFRKPVTVDWEKRDRYGRIIGKILINDVDAGLRQIVAGVAWHYKHYEKEQAPQDRRDYSVAEDAARLSGVGLWAQPAPVAPWEFRRR